MQGIEATKQVMHERAKAREANGQLMRLVHPVAKREIDPRPTGRDIGGPTPGKMTRNAAAAVTKTLNAAERIGKTLDVVASAIESFRAAGNP